MILIFILAALGLVVALAFAFIAPDHSAAAMKWVIGLAIVLAISFARLSSGPIPRGLEELIEPVPELTEVVSQPEDEDPVAIDAMLRRLRDRLGPEMFSLVVDNLVAGSRTWLVETSLDAVDASLFYAATSPELTAWTNAFAVIHAIGGPRIVILFEAADDGANVLYSVEPGG